VFARAEARTREPLDLLGAALIAAGLSLLTVTLSFGQEWGWASGRHPRYPMAPICAKTR
jgi:hypothetical protein